MGSKRPARVIAVVTTLATTVSTALLMVPAPAGATFGTADMWHGRVVHCGPAGRTAQ